MLDILTELLAEWCELHELEHASADELQVALIQKRDRMWRSHEDVERVQAQIEWLEAYITLWDLTDEAA